jgi:hypothetical protein
MKWYTSAPSGYHSGGRDPPRRSRDLLVISIWIERCECGTGRAPDEREHLPLAMPSSAHKTVFGPPCGTCTGPSRVAARFVHPQREHEISGTKCDASGCQVRAGSAPFSSAE